ncbi:hypothetical protein BCR43DRAFT_489037 [Syncephalastrum racemosum]|uniref:Uncharacterized protein n=1 Tax=Syncephalastrum racemosum TaxID=13706 RepID=A0A1X2HJR2_SYNRA|nr:hypothetical protein BCR43DRAFT_489037 [Syncephalastrum racemosum]
MSWVTFIYKCSHINVARALAAPNNVRTFTLHVGGLSNTLRIRLALALRPVNSSFASDFQCKLEPGQFTMRADDFSDALASHTTTRKAIDEARPSHPAPRPPFSRRPCGKPSSVG